MVNGIQSEFMKAADQSCLNRFLNEAPWDPKAFNDARLALLQKEHDTRYSRFYPRFLLQIRFWRFKSEFAKVQF